MTLGGNESRASGRSGLFLGASSYHQKSSTMVSSWAKGARLQSYSWGLDMAAKKRTSARSGVECAKAKILGSWITRSNLVAWRIISTNK